MNLFKELYYSVPEGQIFTLESMSASAARRFHESIAGNSFYFYGLYTGVLASNAACVFANRFLANYSNGPEGELTHNVLYSFYALSDDPEPFTYKAGWERIPDEWVSSPAPIGLVEFNTDIVQMMLYQPELLTIGGNMGEVNTFVGKICASRLPLPVRPALSSLVLISFSPIHQASISPIPSPVSPICSRATISSAWRWSMSSSRRRHT